MQDEKADPNLDVQLTAALAGIARVLVRLVRAELRTTPGSPDAWVNQTQSPLGRNLHCRLVRHGELPGRKVGRQVLVRAADLDAYIERHPVDPRPPVASDAGDDVDRELDGLGFGKTAQPKTGGGSR